MDELYIAWKGVKEFEHGIEELIGKADVASKAAVTKGGHLIESKAKQNFSGSHAKGEPRSGGKYPNVVTGSLRRSIHVDSVKRISFGVWQSVTGPSMIYGRRIDLGFNGADSIGRIYHQPPYPYFTDGFEQAKDQLPGIFREAWAAALR